MSFLITSNSTFSGHISIFIQRGTPVQSVWIQVLTMGPINGVLVQGVLEKFMMCLWAKYCNFYSEGKSPWISNWSKMKMNWSRLEWLGYHQTADNREIKVIHMMEQMIKPFFTCIIHNIQGFICIHIHGWHLLLMS